MDEKILLIDDDYAFSEIAGLVLLQAGYQVRCADCPAKAFPLLAKEAVDLILCDLHMPFITGEFEDDFITSYETGIRTIQELRFALPLVPIVGLSAAAQCDLDKISGQVFPDVIVSKPSDCNDLLKIVEVFLAMRRSDSSTEQLYIV